MKKKLLAIGVASALIVTGLGCGEQQSTSQQKEKTENSQTESSGQTNKESTGSQDKAKESSFLSEEEAKAAALADAGVEEKDTSNLRIRLKTEDGQQEYDIEFYVGSTDYDYDIDAASGAILSKEAEQDKHHDTGSQGNPAVSLEEAKTTALDRVEGSSDSEIRIHLEEDDGKLIYEGSIWHENVEYEFHIDGQTGEVVKWEEELAHE